jgi:cytochrome c-type biogenesis protein CcmH/NrfF
VVWVVPLLFLAAGAVLIAATLRKSAEATLRLRDECAELEQLRSALVELGQEADTARATIDRIRSRPERSRVDR